MGDQDDAMDRMHVEGDDVLVGRAGYDGDIDDFITFGSGRGIFASGLDATDDATKITYFTPRFAGFQVAASMTSDTGQHGLSAPETDNDADFEQEMGRASHRGRV